ncbi:hypothetical protein CHUAL_008408 [Chamberlinius hualienensis]
MTTSLVPFSWPQSSSAGSTALLSGNAGSVLSRGLQHGVCLLLTITSVYGFYILPPQVLMGRDAHHHSHRCSHHVSCLKTKCHNSHDCLHGKSCCRDHKHGTRCCVRNRADHHHHSHHHKHHHHHHKHHKHKHKKHKHKKHKHKKHKHKKHKHKHHKHKHHKHKHHKTKEN